MRFLAIPADGVINGDGAYYARLGEKIVSGDLLGGISGYWSPFYSLLAGIASLFISDVELGGRLISGIAGAALIIPAYLLFREFYGRVPAYLGAILLVVHPYLIQSSTWVMTEAVFTLIFVTVILVGWRALYSGKFKGFFLTGVLWGIAYLTKPESVAFVALMLVFVVSAGLFHRAIPMTRYAIGYLLVVFGFLALFAPYVIYLHQKTGQWTISQKILINLPAADYEKGLLSIPDDGTVTMQDRIWGDNYEGGAPTTTTAAAPSTPSSDRSWRDVKSDAVILGSKALSSLKAQLRDYVPTILPFPFILMAIVGFFAKPWTRIRTAREAYLSSFVISLFAGYAISAAELRYVFPLIPILIGWAANGIVEFSAWFSRSLWEVFRSREQIRPVFVQSSVLVLLAASLIPTILGFQEKIADDAPFEEKRAGLWLKDRINSDSSVVMAPNMTVAFYAGAKHLFLPNEPLADIVNYARHQNVTYLVFSERRLRFNPAAFPTDEANIPSQLSLVYKDEDTLNRRLRIYQFSQ